MINAREAAEATNAARAAAFEASRPKPDPEQQKRIESALESIDAQIYTACGKGHNQLRWCSDQLETMSIADLELYDSKGIRTEEGVFMAQWMRKLGYRVEYDPLSTRGLIIAWGDAIPAPEQ